MKRKKGTTVLLILAIIIVAGAFIYFVAGVSSVSPPIKKYQYSGSVDELIYGIRRYASTNAGVTFKVTDTTGNRENGYAYYMTIRVQKSGHFIEYGLKCERNNDNATLKTDIGLVAAIDLTSLSGGYIKDAKGIQPLVDYFDSGFLVELKNKQNINFIPL